MTRRLVILGVSLVVAASAVTVALGGSSASIRVLNVQPLIVSGVHFNPYERLTVAASAGMEKTLKQVKATRQGSFKVTLVGFHVVDPCGTNQLIRVLRKGRRAVSRTLHVSKESRGVACFVAGP